MSRIRPSCLLFSLCLLSTSASAGDTRYGAFGLLDHRSIYGKYWFPEPLTADEADVDNEFRIDWFHGEGHHHQIDELKVEIEKSFGLLTLEIAPTYESDRSASFDGPFPDRESEKRLGNVELGARYPVYQYVSPSGFFDTTIVLGLEVAVPTNTRISKDTEIVPKVFTATRLGEHFSVQTIVGDSILIGAQEHGLSTFEYNLVLGYELPKNDLPLPGVLTTNLLAELQGETAVNHDEHGQSLLAGTVGVRFNFDAISWLPAQPRLGLGYTFPIDRNAKDEFQWGIVTSLIFEY